MRKQKCGNVEWTMLCFFLLILCYAVNLRKDLLLLSRYGNPRVILSKLVILIPFSIL